MSSASCAAGFVLRPGAITLALAALAIGLAAAEERITPVQAWSDFLDRLFPPEPEAAHVVLGTIAGSMITVVSVVYSILLVVLTFASTQFSPRVLVAFVEDRVSQTTLGLFVGTFTYCLLTLPAVRSQPEPFVPSIAVIVAIGLAIACLACLLYFIHHMASSIQASHIVDRVARETEHVLDEVFPGPLDGSPPERTPTRSPRGMPMLRDAVGLHPVDRRGGPAGGRAGRRRRVRVDRYIGQFVVEGTPLFEISPAGPGDRTPGGPPACAPSTSARRARWSRTSSSASCRSWTSRLKAISPAVNDPTTAMTCIDQLGRILVRAAMRQPPVGTLVDPDGRARVALRRTSFPRLLDVAFSQIRHYGKADVAVPSAADAQSWPSWPPRRGTPPTPSRSSTRHATVGRLRPGIPRSRPR